MKLLITGGLGFLGSNLVASAIARKDCVCVIDNLSRQGSYTNFLWLKECGQFEFCHADIRSENDVTRVIQAFQPDAVLHLAGQVAMTTSLANPRLDFEVNALGTINVLEAVRNFVPHACVIYSSTNKVYGDLEQFSYTETATRYICQDYPKGFDENTPLDFHSPYGCSKGSADQYLLDYARCFGLNTVVLRHSSMYGGRQFPTVDQGWVGWFCQQAIAQTQSADASFTVSGNGKQVRDVLHAQDMNRLYMAVLEKSLSQPETMRGQVFNVGGGMENSLSLLELFHLLESLLGISLRMRMQENRISDQRVFVADISKAKHLLDWDPQVSVTQGVQDMLHWLRTCK